MEGGLPKARPLAAVMLADVDGTLIPYYGSLQGEAVEAILELESLGVEIVPVTAKSAAEVWSLWSQAIGRPPRIAVVESGGAIYSQPGLLSRPHGSETLEGDTVEYTELAPEISEWRPLLVEALNATGCRGFMLLAGAPRSVAEEITLLSGRAAELAALRRYLEVVYHERGECLDKAALEAEKRGLYTFRSRRLLHVAMHRGKKRAVEVLLEEPLVRHARLVAAAGDSPADKELLEVADEPFLVAPQGRSWIRGVARRYTPIVEPPPEAVKLIAETLKHRLAPPSI